MDLNNIVGFKAVDKNGKERQVTVDEMTELVSARIVSAASEISTFAAAAAAGTDEFEDQLPQSDTFSWLRTLDGSKNPTLTSSSAAAKVLGELMTKSNYIRIENMSMNFPIYKLSFVRNENMVISIIGEGNSNLADNYIIMKNHNGNQLSFLKNNGPKNILLYIDNNNELYIKLNYYSRVIVYFQNKEPQNNALSATEVDIDISTLTQVGI